MTSRKISGPLDKLRGLTPTTSSDATQPIDTPPRTSTPQNSGSPSPVSTASLSNLILNNQQETKEDDLSLLDLKQIRESSIKESSPLKEAIFTKFARLAPNTSVAAIAPTQPYQIDSSGAVPILAPRLVASQSPMSAGDTSSSVEAVTPTSSWINQVKGRIAKKVEVKYAEYKSEREKLRNLNNSNLSTSFDSSAPLTYPKDLMFSSSNSNSEEELHHTSLEKENSHSNLNLNLLSHSASENKITESFATSLPNSELMKSSHSQNFVTKKEENEESLDEVDSVTPKVIVASSTPKDTRRRFTFSFRGDRSSPAKPSSDLNASSPTDITKEVTTTSTTTCSTTTTTTTTSYTDIPITTPGQVPTRASLRSRMISLMSKHTTTPTSQVSSNPEDPFSGTSLDITSTSAPDADDSYDFIEEAMEADEKLMFEVSADQELVDGVEFVEEEVEEEPQEIIEIDWFQYWYVALAPLGILLILQVMPLPYWFIGFLTGLGIGIPLTAYLTWLLLIRDKLEPSRFVDLKRLRSKMPKRNAIIVQEELERQFTWMNMWPSKNGAYDPLTYDVRKTMSVRVMLHGPWIELRFPKRNLPLRRGHDDKEPKNVIFHEHKEVIDLTYCSIDIIPPNLPSKRIWSKKYPIKITTNARKAIRGSGQDSSKEVVPPTTTTTSDIGLNKENSAQDPAEMDPDKLEKILKNEQQPPNNESANMSIRMSDLKTDDLAFTSEESSGIVFTDDIERTSSDITRNQRDETDALNQECSSQIVAKDKEEDSLNPFSGHVESDEEIMQDVLGDDDDKSDTSSFEILKENGGVTFYLFARTSREKEEWFNKFMQAAKFMEDWNHQNPGKDKSNEEKNKALQYETFKVKEQRFRMFMENYLQTPNLEEAEKFHKETKENEEKRKMAREQLAFLNIFGARLWHDLHKSSTFIDFLREKITRKLLKVKIAAYFDEVSVTTLDLGTQLPQILSASLPYQDEHGLWVQLEVEYNGVCQATIETRGIRLPGKDEPDREAQELAGRQAATIYSDEEDSAEDDDDVPDSCNNSDINGGYGAGNEGQVHGSDFKTRMLEGLLKSEFVAKVAESEWVKKNIRSRNITLQLQLHSLKGTLTLNMPPAPSDRVWYGFRYPPKMVLALRPCFGGRSLGKYESTFAAMMRHLEKRLIQEFVKVMVYPNMDDEVLPFLDHVSYSLL